MLLQQPPVKILNQQVPTSFLWWMKNVGRVLDSKLFYAEKVEVILLNVFGSLPPEEQIEKALLAVMDFYACGEAQSDNEKPPERLLDWEQDSARIWADFRLYAGIDLDKANLHWWEFRALFNSLPPESQIMHAISVRAIDLSQIEDPRQRAAYERQKRAFALDSIDYDALYDNLWERRNTDAPTI